MSCLQEFGRCCVHWSLGLTVLIGVAASEFSGPATIASLPVTITAITLSALSDPTSTQNTYKKRKFGDVLEFFKIWLEILEILAVTATCARIVSATVDYVSSGRLREWFLGLESHSMGEPWPDVIGVSVIIVVTGLFMLGLEKSPYFSALLLLSFFTSFVFFVVVGSTHTTIALAKWAQDFKKTSTHSILSSATVCSYGFLNTFPPLARNCKFLKVPAMILLPMLLYSSAILVFTLMSHYNELTGTATPLLRIFEIRDVDWARLVMAICIISTISLALTEVLPNLYGLFVSLASTEWQIFLTSLQYKNTFTGAPILAIFASGSLSAILAFACPLSYLVRIINTAALLKCIVRSFQVLHLIYRPEFRSESYLVSSTTTQYSKLKQPKRLRRKKFRTAVSGYLSGLKKNISPSINKPSTSQDNECLLMDDYCDKSLDVALAETSEESEKESILSSDVEDSSTDIDAVVQEYKDKIEVATIDNFHENKHATYVTATTVAIFLMIIIIASICLSQVVVWKMFSLSWPCFITLIISTAIILAIPKNEVQMECLLPKSLASFCAILSLQLNILLVSTIITSVWSGFIFWLCAGGLLFWRCDCCTCEGLINERRLKVAEDVDISADRYVDTILIAR